MKRALIISNLATVSLLVIWTSGQTLAWKMAGTPVCWVTVAWLLDDLWELAGEFRKGGRRCRK